jgi:hypothetical protein
LGSKESVSSSDILPKENNGFTRKIFAYCLIFLGLCNFHRMSKSYKTKNIGE